LKKPVVDEKLCIGCELCVNICPEVFAMKDDGLATVIDPDGAPEDKIQEAIDSCPVKAIRMESD
jgi:ferredoxin